jgi:hypothetical protein
MTIQAFSILNGVPSPLDKVSVASKCYSGFRMNEDAASEPLKRREQKLTGYLARALQGARNRCSSPWV